MVEPVVETAFDEELAFAHELADLAGKIGLGFFRGSFEVTIKPDRTPVTEADLSIESAIRDAVKERYPEDSVLGEEGGLQGEGRRRWIVDPIDGTKNFADGVQIWSNLIALAVDDEPVLGVVNLPALGERYDASRGGGARLNGAPIHVSRVDSVPRSFVVAGMGTGCRAHTPPVSSTCSRTRGETAGSATRGVTAWWRRARPTSCSSSSWRRGTSRHCR